jgi:hypothetical protein
VAVPREATSPSATPALLATLPAIELRTKLDGEPLRMPFGEARPWSRPERRLFLEHCALLI